MSTQERDACNEVATMEESEKANGEQPATDKQRNFIRYLVGGSNITKTQASGIIDLLKGEQEETSDSEESQEE